MFQMSLIFSHFLGKLFALRQLTQDSNAWLDIAANGFWEGRFEHSFFDFRVFNSGAPSNHPLSQLIVAMRGRRDVSMSSVFVRLNMAILHC